MADNVVNDDVEPKPVKNEGSGEGSSDVKPTVNLKPFKVQIPMQAQIGKIEEPKPVPIGVIYKARDTKCKMKEDDNLGMSLDLLDRL